MLGPHLLKTWSSTQPSISLFSGEAEYYGVVKAAGSAIGQQSLMEDMGIKVGVRVWTDSSSAMGVCGRSGSANSVMCRLIPCGSKSAFAQEPFNCGR